MNEIRNSKSVTILLELIRSKVKQHPDVSSLISDPELIKAAEESGCILVVKKLKDIRLIGVIPECYSKKIS